MNRFLTKKRAKKAPAPARVELDLAAALPSQDDFRTSLIMPNLSARFSMLREQDDPNSKLGKASDDSVLTPRRQSRLPDFGFVAGGLSDIAEVSSIHSMPRPPPIGGRQGSYASDDGYGTDDNSNGSIMSRARPGEGNVLFGGRQKVYKIAVSTSDGASAKSGGMPGKAVYDDDISLSAFQKHRQEERQRQLALEELERNTLSAGHQDDALNRRNTDSSTNSGPSHDPRTSTAATSVNSQTATSALPSSPVLPTSAKAGQTPMDRSNTKARRLYEQGLNRDMQEQQSSAMNRLNSINRNPRLDRAMSPPMVSRARSPSNGPDLSQRIPRPFRTASPTPSGGLPTPTSLETIKDDQPLPRAGALPYSPPQSPLASDTEDVGPLGSAIRPADRGKATALGAFNRPKQFCEEQYLERQKQIQETRESGRESPVLRRDMPSAAGSERLQANLEFRPAAREPPVPRRDFSAPNVKPISDTCESGRESPMFRREAPGAIGPERLRPVPKPREAGRDLPMFRRDFSSAGRPEPPRLAQGGRESPILRRDMSLTAGPFSKKPSANSNASEAAVLRSRSPTIDSQPKYSVEEARPAPLNLPPKPSSNPTTPPPEEASEKPLEKPKMPSAFAIFQKAANQMKTGAAEKPEETHGEPPEWSNPPATGGFLASASDSDNEDEQPPTIASVSGRQTPIRLNDIPRAPPPVSEHPALRAQPPIDFELDPPPFSQFLNAEGSRPASRSRVRGNEDVEKPLDSPTIRDSASGALGGMVHQHLRTTSSVSSVYSVQASTSKPAVVAENGDDAESAKKSRAEVSAHSSYSPSNPWDLEDLDRAYYGEAHSSGVSPIDGPKPNASSKLANQLAQRNDGYMQSTTPANEPTWQQELKTKHNRDGSTATAAEREAFANELEQRKRAIQESLRNKVGNTSAMTDSEKDRGPTHGINKVLGTLRAKNSRDSMNKAADTSSKAMKILGISGNPNASTPALPSIKDGKSYHSDFTRSESNLDRTEPRPSRPGTRQAIHEEEPHHGRNTSPPRSSATSTRNRSSSEVSNGRSRSRPPVRYREDLDRPVTEGPNGRARGLFPADELPSLDPSLEVPSFAPGGIRGGPTPSSPGYFSPAGSPHIGSPHIGSPRASPGFQSPMVNGMPSPALSGRIGTQSPALGAARTMATPYATNSTPPVPSSTIPVGPTFENAFRQTSSSRPRKRSVLKSEISEPKLLSTTNNIDTIDLPPGASLANGMDEVDPPPLPPINPRRRRFGFGRTGGDATLDGARISPPGTSYADGSHVHSADEEERGFPPVSRLRKVTSEGWGLNAHARGMPGANDHPPPAMPVYGGNRGPSPPRVVNGMF